MIFVVDMNIKESNSTLYTILQLPHQDEESDLHHEIYLTSQSQSLDRNSVSTLT